MFKPMFLTSAKNLKKFMSYSGPQKVIDLYDGEQSFGKKIK
jgi:hypothetical protein